MKALSIYRQGGLPRWAWLLSLFLSLSCSLAWAQTSTVVIAEIMYDNPLQDNEAVRTGVNGEFLSLYNYGEDDVNIGGWRVEITNMLSSSKYTYTIPTGTILPSLSLAIIASRASSTFDIWSFYGTSKPDSSSDIVLYTSGLAFPDTRTKVSIYNAQGVLEDEVTYDGNSAALQDQALLRAMNNVNLTRPLLQVLSIQRREIVISEGTRVISRNDYYASESTPTVRLFEYLPEEYSYTESPSAYAVPPADRTLNGTVGGNNDERASTIKSSQVISSGKTSYWTENGIIFYPGFEVRSGVEFIAGVNRDSVNHIKILTYNVWGDKHKNYADHARVIKNSGADIASIQEVKYYGKYKTLKDNTGLSGDWFGSWPGVYGVAMLWNPAVVGDPITKSYKRIYNLWEDDDLVRVFIVAEFEHFCFVATHYSTVDKYKIKMTELILGNELVKKCLNNGKPVYIAGDLNAEPNEVPIRKFIERGFEVLNNTNPPDSLNHATFYKDGKPRYIDLILEHNIQPYHKTIEHGIPVSDGGSQSSWRNEMSDHYPYRVRVKIK